MLDLNDWVDGLRSVAFSLCHYCRTGMFRFNSRGVHISESRIGIVINLAIRVSGLIGSRQQFWLEDGDHYAQTGGEVALIAQ